MVLLLVFLGNEEMNEMFSCLGISRQPLNTLRAARNNQFIRRDSNTNVTFKSEGKNSYAKI